MKQSTKYIVLGVIILFVLLIGGTFVYVIQRTSFLTKLTPDQVAQNNGSSSDQANDSSNNLNLDLTTLVSTQVKVPDDLKNGVFADDRFLNLPSGFQVSLFMSGIDGARALDFTAAGNVIVAARDAGSVYLIKKVEGSDFGGELIKIDSGLNNPHGVDYYNGDLYVGAQNQIILYKDLSENGTYSSKKVIIDNLPTGGHITRTVQVGPDQKLYVAIGSSCNLCEESDPNARAAILRFNLDGSGRETLATGLRNTVDFVFHETDNALQFWGVDNGRDNLGDDLPPEEVNIIRQGKNYGWPYCYGSQLNNPEYPDRADYCKNSTEAPLYEMQAHSAPLGLTFVPGASSSQNVKFPTDLSDDLFITFHGSWNRSVPTGYKVVRIPNAGKNTNLDTTSSDQTVNFITGFVDSKGKVWGRPVGIRFDINGDMYLTDDQADAVYKISYSQD